MNDELDKCEMEIISFCHDLTTKLIAKYRRGREEHGSNWEGIDCNKEIAEEVKDILNYHCIFKAQKSADIEFPKGYLCCLCGVSSQTKEDHKSHVCKESGYLNFKTQKENL